MFSKAITRRPSPDFGDGITTAGLGAPDYDLALDQHSAYCAALQSLGLDLIVLEYDSVYPDSVFVEDTAVITEKMAVITRPGDPRRLGEEVSIAQTLSLFRELHVIESPGTLDGGDVMRAEDHFFIGRSERTNVEGALQLSSLLSRFGYTSSIVDTDGHLHLKEFANYIGDNILVVLKKMALLDEFKRFEMITVDAEEAYCANCLSVNGTILFPSGFDRTREKLASKGMDILQLEMSEFRKMDGGLTCLSLRF